MTLQKPYKRTVRMLSNGTYHNGGHWQYLLHPKFASDPQHYIRAFLLIQEDLLKLFEYVEPCDENSETISLRIQELLTRVCIEIEANFTAILKDNIYSTSKNYNLKDDYSLIEYTHKLSSYRVKFPVWKGDNHTYIPFENWETKPNKNWHTLNWYQAYNKSKHDRHSHFDKATFNTLLNAVSGLVVILSSQFMDESYSPNTKSMGVSGNYSYDYNPKMETAIGDYFRVQFPDSWDESEKYDFNWQELSSKEEPFDKINYDLIKKANNSVK
jgi:hypothetical protein